VSIPALGEGTGPEVRGKGAFTLRDGNFRLPAQCSHTPSDVRTQRPAPGSVVTVDPSALTWPVLITA
jgi:hypothetical protein